MPNYYPTTREHVVSTLRVICIILVIILITVLFASCNYHIEELVSDGNPTGSSNVEIFHYVIVAIVILVIYKFLTYKKKLS